MKFHLKTICGEGDDELLESIRNLAIRRVVTRNGKEFWFDSSTSALEMALFAQTNSLRVIED